MDNHSLPSPLSGYRVLDFGWVLAGALPGMILADMGAEVIKVESHKRMDYMRLGRPIIGDDPDPEQNPMFHNVNRGKLSITLNTKEPKALTLVKELVSHCDILIENFSPGVMGRLGLSYEVLKNINPKLVMVSISSNGQSGPLRDLRAYAPSIGALSGLDSTIGYKPDNTTSRPLGLKHAYGDICGALHSVFAILSALYNRLETGQGQYIDLSMLRATVSTMGAGLMEYEMTGRVLTPQGNYDPTMAPYGNYPCNEPDSWISIAVRTEEEWQGLKEALNDPDWCELPIFNGRYQRLKHTAELDIYMANYTSNHGPYELAELLQSHKVAAIPVMNAEDRLSNQHFQARRLYSEIEHPSLGMEPIFNLMWNFSDTPLRIQRHAPLMGEHNLEIFRDLLGLSIQEIEELKVEQVIW